MDQPLFAEGDPVVVLDARGRHRYCVLEAGGKQGLPGDQFQHDRALGQPHGLETRTRRGRSCRVLPATLADHVAGMPKHAAIIQPKDIASILVHTDIRPGHTVVEGGYGSGSLTTALLQAVGDTGRVITYENRQEAANRAAKNVATWLGETPRHTVHIADLYDGIHEELVDRVVLDVPEPWRALPAIRQSLVFGGVLCCYLPTILQVQRLVVAMSRGRVWCRVRAIEVLERAWHITPQSVRPEHSMVAHTGFLVFARRSAEVEGADEVEDEAAADPTPDDAET